MRSRTQPYVDQNPRLKKGYDSFFKAWMIYGNIPWLIMSIGNLSGITNNVFDYFHPRSMNPAVLVFHSSIILLYVLIIRWIYLKKGADFFSSHPGIFVFRGIPNSGNGFSSRWVKVFTALMLLVGIVAMGAMWIVDFPHFVTS